MPTAWRYEPAPRVRGGRPISQMGSVAEVIRGRRQAILDRWAESAGRAASARGLERPELLNLLPEYLDALARDASDAERATLVANHLASRLREGFHVEEIVDEFALLGRCIAEEWSGLPPTAAPPAADVERLRDELHRRSAEIVDTFTRHMREDEQNDKRVARALERLAAQRRRESAPLDRALRDLLAITMEAMEAQSAVLLLYRVSTDDLLTAAATGVGHEELERYAMARKDASFVARIGAAHRPEQIADIETTAPEVSDALRRSGIHALLGVRLPPQYELVGVLYVGRAERRPFAEREVRRLEMLAERILLHLEAARLDESLRRTIDELQAERASREQFVALLAHDLRGPLTAAKIHARLLVSRPELLETRVDVARKIDENIDRTDRMVRDFLDANRIRSGQKLPLNVTGCDLADVARAVSAELAATHGKRFTIEAPDGLRGYWDEDELRRALWNLGTNAVKHGAPDRPITLRVSQAGDRARVSVHNFGPTLSDEERARVFDAFMRVSNASSRGWGLGLTLVRGCADAHGGRVDVESSSGETTFTLELPVDARETAD